MNRRVSIIGATMFFLLVAMGERVALAQKIKFATPIKLSIHYYLPLLAAEEKGLWKQNGVDAEWFPFKGGADMYRAVAAREINVGFSIGPSVVQSNSRGLPVVLVAALVERSLFAVWVRADSPLKKPEDLKGKTIGVIVLGAATHNYGLVAVRALGLEKDVKFVGAGGLLESLAAMKVGSIHATVEPTEVMIGLKAKGEARELLRVADYLPKEWLEHVVFARRDFVAGQPDTLRRLVKTVFQGISLALQEPAWSVKKIKETSGVDDKTAQEAYNDLTYSKTGRITAEALRNVINFSVEYGLVAKDKAPRVEDAHAPGFTD